VTPSKFQSVSVNVFNVVMKKAHTAI